MKTNFLSPAGHFIARSAFILLIALAISGCSEDDENEKQQVTPALTVSPEALPFTTAEAASQTVTVTANVDWTVTKNGDFITVTPATGSNNGAFTVSVSANTDAESLSGAVIVTGGGITRTIDVTQAGAITPVLTVNTETLPFTTAEAASQTVTVTANIDWEVTKTGGFISLSATSGSNDGAFAVNVSANTGTETLSGTVTVAGGGITRAIVVTQPGVTPPEGVIAISHGGAMWADRNLKAVGEWVDNATDLGYDFQAGVAKGATVIAAGDPCPDGWRLPTEAIMSAAFANNFGNNVSWNGNLDENSEPSANANEATLTDANGHKLVLPLYRREVKGQGPNPGAIYLTGPLSSSAKVLSFLGWAQNFNGTISGTESHWQTRARCIQGEKPAPDPILEVSTTNVELPAGGGTQAVTITADIAWTASVATGGDFITVTPTVGSIGITIATANTSTASRTGKVTVTGTGTGITREITVTQLGVTPPEGVGEVPHGGAIWADRNLKAPGEWADSPNDLGYDFQAGVAGGATVIAAGDPCPTGWSLPTEAIMSAAFADAVFTNNANPNITLNGNLDGDAEPSANANQATLIDAGGHKLVLPLYRREVKGQGPNLGAIYLTGPLSSNAKVLSFLGWTQNFEGTISGTESHWQTRARCVKN
jgi:hypothetical protein